jgi:hypothetical protein
MPTTTCLLVFDRAQDKTEPLKLQELAGLRVGNSLGFLLLDWLMFYSWACELLKLSLPILLILVVFQAIADSFPSLRHLDTLMSPVPGDASVVAYFAVKS